MKLVKLPLCFIALVLLVPVLVLAPVAVQAASPGPAGRQAALGLGTCDGGDFDGDVCVDDGDCDDGSSHASASATCSSNTLDLEVRGFLTILSDKDSGRFESVETVPYVEDRKCADGPFQGEACEENSDCRTPDNDAPICRTELLPADFSKSTLSLILEFTKNGERHVFAETYKDLGDYVDADLGIDCSGFCVPAGLPGSVGWREPAVESRIASGEAGGVGGVGGGGGGGGGSGGGGGGGGRAGGDGIRIRWAQAPPAIAAALIEALELPDGSVPYLEVVSTTSIVDRSAEDDPLASVRTLKVTIRALGPPPVAP